MSRVYFEHNLVFIVRNATSTSYYLAKYVLVVRLTLCGGLPWVSSIIFELYPTGVIKKGIAITTVWCAKDLTVSKSGTACGVNNGKFGMNA